MTSQLRIRLYKSNRLIICVQFELGTVPIPKSVTKSRIEQNIDIFDFQLSAEERSHLDTFHNGSRLVGLSDCKASKYYPFALPF